MLLHSLKKGQPTRVSEVEFALLGEDEIEAMSVAHVTSTNIYVRGIPQIGGINDHRMGTVDRRLHCGTCGEDVRLCAGHPGHINLAFPCYHVGYVDTVLKILRSVCFFCARVCVHHDDIEVQVQDLSGKARMLFVYGVARNKKQCPHCGAPRPQYNRSCMTLRIEWDETTAFESEEERAYCSQPLTAATARSILQNVPDEDYRLMGFTPERSHPKHCILTRLVVPPPVARPAIMASEGSRARGQDDLTLKLQDINKRNADVEAALANWSITSGTPPPADALDKISRLQFDVFTYMNNSIRGQKQSTQRSGAPTKSVSDRLKGKEGRIRGNLMGKRVDFSARSVITPDALMDIDQVGVPIGIALALTVPERVTPRNIHSLMRRVMAGAKVLEGAETVIMSNGTTIHLECCTQRDRIRLQHGWIVERYLQDDDPVIFNRQPSLHKMGMMGHRVKVMPGHTFRLNLSCANPYNADFDGDEMNMHVPQSTCTRAEVLGIMMVPQQIISPQANKPVMGIVQDSLLAWYLLSDEGTLVTEQDAMMLAHCIKYPTKCVIPLPPPAVFLPQRMWTGGQIFSFLLPPKLTMNRASVLIDEGQLLRGRLDKSMLGTSVGGLIDILYRDMGATIAARFMSDAQRVGNKWLAGQAFAVGIKDCVLKDEAQERINNAVATTVRSTDELLRELGTEASKSKDTAELLEGTVVQMLSRLLMLTGGIVQEYTSSTNAVQQMVQAGSKGNLINLSQILACVGQQSVEGQRIQDDETHGRTLPYFAKADASVNGHGLVQNSYALGLMPYEYMFHAMGGREGLVDTAVKTANTGYLQRRLVKSMEDNQTQYDGTVRNAEGSIIEFAYGGDGYDPSKLEKYEFSALITPPAQIAEWMTGEETATIDELVNLLSRLRMQRTDPMTKKVCTAVLLPFNVHRLMHYRWRVKAHETRASTEDVLRVRDRLLQSLPKRLLIRAIILYFVSPAHVIRQRMSVEELHQVEQHMLQKERTARVAAGEAVGAIAAQSVGEPCTQMTLNTFHYAGVSSKNVTLGIPRLREILDFSKQMRTPLTTLSLRKPFARNRRFVSQLADSLPSTQLHHIVRNVQVVRGFADEDDGKLLELGQLFQPIPDDCGPFAIRAVLDRKMMMKRAISPVLVRQTLQSAMRDRAHVITSEVNAIEWILIMHFRGVSTMLKGCDENLQKMLIERSFRDLSDTVTFGGFQGVDRCTMREVTCWDEDKMVYVDEYVVDVQNSGVLVDMTLIPAVEWRHSTSNDIHEVLEIFGIEATVELLFRQIVEVISFDGTYVDARHILLIVNTMTYRGYVMPLSRHGLNRTDIGPLMRCSFEETVETLYDAALFNDTDRSQGVTQNIMTGQLTRLGTGCFDVRLKVTTSATNTAPSLVTTPMQEASAHPSAPTSVLVKSRLRHCANNASSDTADMQGSKMASKVASRPSTIGDTFEYIDSDVWNWRRPPCGSDMRPPFQTVPTAMGASKNEGGDVRPKRRRPSSPSDGV